MKTLTISIILIVALVAGCDQGGEPPILDGPNGETKGSMAVNKGDRWLPSDDPTRWDENLEFRVTELPQDGAAAQTPWTGSYWPTYEDSIAYRWDGEETLSPAGKYGAAFEIADVADKVSAKYGVDSRATATECTEDSVCDDSIGEVCAKRAGEETGRCIPSWWGICHAWAPAAILEPEPIHPVTRNGVEFKVNDLKALVSLVYNHTQATMLSLRCNEDEENGDITYDNYGNPTGEDLECKDTNAGTFHVIVANYLGLRGEAFVEDRTFDDEVWNQPVSAYRITRQDEITAAEAAVLAGAELSGDQGGQQHTLEGTVDEGSWKHFGSISVPKGSTARVVMSGSGDPDLYVRKGTQPNLNEWDCRPWIGGAAEECNIPAVVEDIELYVSAYGYSASTGFQIVVDVAGASDAGDLAVDETLEGTVAKGEWKHFGSYPVPAGGTLHVVMSGDGDPDLYVGTGGQPTKATWTCRPYVGGAAEECTLENLPAAAEVFLSVHGYQASTGFSLHVTVAGPGAPDANPYVFNLDAVTFYDVRLELDYIGESSSRTDGNLSSVISQYTHTDVYTYVLEVDADGRVIGGEWTGSSKKAHPDFLWLPTGRYNYPIAGGAITYDNVKSLLNESVAPTTGTDTPSDGSLSESGTLAKGVWAHFGPFDVGNGELSAAITGTGDADLYVRRGAQPTLSGWDCRPYKIGSNEICALTGPAQVYVSVHGYAPTSTYNLAVTWSENAASPGPGTDPVSPAAVHLSEAGNVPQGVMKFYTLPVAAGQTVVVKTQAPQDVDLYLRLGAAPTTSTYDMRAYTASGNETLTYTAPASGVLHIGVNGYKASSYTLTTSDG